MQSPRTDRRAFPALAWPLPPDLAAKRALLEAAGGRFCAVTFRKKDGTERRMQVQPATLRTRLRGDAASEAARRATRTREARHPHLLPVWDVRARAPRSINLATVSRIAVDGQVHRFAA
jgi:ribosomal protein S12 methylthiotransferase accessory factor YcaO